MLTWKTKETSWVHSGYVEGGYTMIMTLIVYIHIISIIIIKKNANFMLPDTKKNPYFISESAGMGPIDSICWASRCLLHLSSSICQLFIKVLHPDQFTARKHPLKFFPAPQMRILGQPRNATHTHKIYGLTRGLSVWKLTYPLKNYATIL